MDCILIINMDNWGYNPFTNLLLTSSNFLRHPSGGPNEESRGKVLQQTKKKMR